MFTGKFVLMEKEKPGEKVILTNKGVKFVFLTLYTIELTTFMISVFFLGLNIYRISTPQGSWVNDMWIIFASISLIATALTNALIIYLTILFYVKRSLLNKTINKGVIYVSKGMLLILFIFSVAYFVTDLSLLFEGREDVSSLQDVFGDVIIFIVSFVAMILFHWIDTEIFRGKTVDTSKVGTTSYLLEESDALP